MLVWLGCFIAKYETQGTRKQVSGTSQRESATGRSRRTNSNTQLNNMDTLPLQRRCWKVPWRLRLIVNFWNTKKKRNRRTANLGKFRIAGGHQTALKYAGELSFRYPKYSYCRVNNHENGNWLPDHEKWIVSTSTATCTAIVVD
jgi:hypothetical protein